MLTSNESKILIYVYFKFMILIFLLIFGLFFYVYVASEFYIFLRKM